MDSDPSSFIEFLKEPWVFVFLILAAGGFICGGLTARRMRRCGIPIRYLIGDAPGTHDLKCLYLYYRMCRREGKPCGIVFWLTVGLGLAFRVYFLVFAVHLVLELLQTS